jgi:hypothetical protein
MKARASGLRKKDGCRLAIIYFGRKGGNLELVFLYPRKFRWMDPLVVEISIWSLIPVL